MSSVVVSTHVPIAPLPLGCSDYGIRAPPYDESSAWVRTPQQHEVRRLAKSEGFLTELNSLRSEVADCNTMFKKG